MTIEVAPPRIKAERRSASSRNLVGSEGALRAYAEISEQLQPYPDRTKQIGDKDYLATLPQRWAGFAELFTKISNDAGQLI